MNKYYMQLFCNFDNNVVKIILYDFFQEIEYQKNEWGTISREIIDKDVAYYNPFFIIDRCQFNLIYSLNLKEYYNINYEIFLKKNGLEHYLI